MTHVPSVAADFELPLVIARNPVPRAVPLAPALVKRIASRNWETRATACIALAEIVRLVTGHSAQPIAGVSVTGVANATRLIQPGDLFAALPGGRTHGAKFAGDAQQHGAVAVLEKPGVARWEIPRAIRRDTQCPGSRTR